MLRARFFGQFCVSGEDGSPVELRAQKSRELLAYLLLHAKRPHRREALASLLWGEKPTAQSKKYLRQALWHLQSAFRLHNVTAGGELLLISADSVQVNPAADLWTDVSAFETARAAGRSRPGERLDAERARLLEEAVDLYRGELLDGWYHDCFLGERDRLQESYLEMLEKLLAYHAGREDHEQGVACAARILSHDRARETAHRQLMRSYYRAGDRAAALRQYAQCASALEEELDVEPSAETVALYEQIRRDRQRVPIDVGSAPPALQPPSLTLAEIVDHLQRAKQLLSDLHDQVMHDLNSLERLLPLQTAREIDGINPAIVARWPSPEQLQTPFPPMSAFDD